MHPDKDTLWSAATSSLEPCSRKAKQPMWLPVCLSIRLSRLAHREGERERSGLPAGGEGVVDAGR